MSGSAILTLCVSFFTDVILTAGGTVTGGMLAQQGSGTIGMPPLPVWVLAGILGLMAGARRVQALLAIPPANGAPK